MREYELSSFIITKNENIAYATSASAIYVLNKNCVIPM